MKKAGKYSSREAKICGVLAAIMVVVFAGSAMAQRKVYQRQQSPGSMIKESDVDHQLWESFVVMRKANEGDPPAQHELGLRYLMGKGFEPDTQKAALWIRRAASRDYVLAHYNLGILYHNGWGVEWNPFEAYRCFTKAVKKELPEAEYVVGLMLTENLVVSRDWKEAYRLVKKAADEGFEPARNAVVEFERRKAQTGSDSGRQRPPARREERVRPVFLDFNVDTASRADDRTLIRDFLREASPGLRKALGVSDTVILVAEDEPNLERIEHAAEVGSPEALSLLGRMWEGGIGVKRDLIKSAAYYVRAIRLESPRAPELLWNLLQRSGYKEELELRAKAFDADAQFVWAGLVALRFDQLLSGEQALKLLKQAADQNHKQSIIELGLCYQSGRWVQQDRIKANELWEVARELGSPEARIRLIVSGVMSPRPAGVDSKTLSFLQASVDEGSILAQVGLAYCHEHGLGTVLRKGEAARMYRNAAQRGSQSAYQALRRMHDEIRPADKEFVVRESVE